jgi:hypothetical protein
MWMRHDPWPSRPWAVAFGHPGSVPGVGFVHRDRSLVLPFGTTVSARVAISCAQSLRAVSLVPFDPGVVCRSHAPRSIPARVEDRLGDGDNVVNSDCMTMHNRSQKSRIATQTCSTCASAHCENVRKTDISRRHGVFFPRENTADAVVWPMPVVAAPQKDKAGHDALRSCAALWCRRVVVIAHRRGMCGRAGRASLGRRGVSRPAVRAANCSSHR